MNRLGTPHPRFWPDAADPIGKAWNEAEIFDHVLFADESHRNHTVGRKSNGLTEDTFEFEDSMRVMAQGSMPEVGS